MSDKGMIVIKVNRCMGCKSCELACAVEHSESKELVGALSETNAPQARVSVRQGQGFAIPLQCRHCQDAPCVKICPTHALDRADPNSPVVLDRELCIGCKFCILACPFGVITLDHDGTTVIKCDQCFERVARGEVPACVEACPTRALDYKTLEEVLSEKRDACLVKIEKGLEGEPR